MAPQAHWWVPLANGERLEFYRGAYNFEEDRSGERARDHDVEFSQKVVSAEVFMSGFDMWYTREGHDHEVMRLRVDTKVDYIGTANPEFLSPEALKKLARTVHLKLIYALTDEDTSDDDDFNTAWIGYTVIAHTKPQT